ncbi:MAG: hypothetical protein EZS28_007050 [Streblomastix strix]|uniref:Importin N-terminal domain-containing protein n=1 Tax=Streblomastix strix TaxID=222440 RepID=A0A5J4WSA7_9EUKA|nr:MAG: hypothetical protein EZS28_007050 [Streblomastix strix]
MEKEGSIYFITQNCLIKGESEDMKCNAAIVLGMLYYDKEIKPERRKILIQQLKVGLREGEQSKIAQQILETISGLAVRQQRKFRNLE